MRPKQLIFAELINNLNNLTYYYYSILLKCINVYASKHLKYHNNINIIDFKIIFEREG